MSKPLPIAVTGVGTVSSHGIGLDDLRAALQKGVPVLETVDKAAGFHRAGSADSACLVSEEVQKCLLSPRLARRMCPASRLAVGASLQAIELANLDAKSLSSRRTGVSLGTAFGTSTFTQKLLEQVDSTGPLSASPFYFMETVASAHAGQIALALNAQGPNVTVSQREASGMLAVCRGAELIAAGLADRVIAGNVDEVTPYVHAALDRFHALARAGEGESERARVFDRNRTGFLAAEGATVLVLEREDLAVARGAAIFARIRAWARANDPSASPADWGSGSEQLAKRLAGQLQRFDVPLSSFDRIVSGASGARKGDVLEGQTLSTAFLQLRLPAVLAPKAITGEYGGAFLAAAILGLQGGAWGFGDWDFESDPDVGTEPAHGRELEPSNRTLVTTLAAGGTSAWLVLENP